MSCDFGITFEPIPTSCPIPGSAVAIVGGHWGEVPLYSLWRNRREIVIQGPKLGLRELHVQNDPGSGPNLIRESQKMYAHYLEIIQTLLHTIEFDRSNWAFLSPNPQGGFRIHYKEIELRKVTCPVWAPFIYEHEVEFTVWGWSSDRRGIWNGKEVDVLYGWNNDWMKTLDETMYGYRLVEGLDLTYEVYGHLIGKNGNVIGLVSEAGWGRMAQPSDRALVYQAVARMQRRGLLFLGCITNRFMIATGKVRLLDLSCVKLKRPSELALLVDAFHWRELDTLFWEIDNIGPYGDCRTPPRRFSESFHELEIMSPLPSPGRPIGGLLLYPQFFALFPVDVWPEYIVTNTQCQKKEGNTQYIPRKSDGLSSTSSSSTVSEDGAYLGSGLDNDQATLEVHHPTIPFGNHSSRMIVSAHHLYRAYARPQRQISSGSTESESDN